MTNIKTQMIASLLEEIDDVEVWSPNEPKYYGFTTRSLSFYKPVDSDSAFLLISQLEHLAYLDSDQPITIYLNTEGGNLTDAFAIYDCIRNLSCPVLIVATGLCASAGLLILAAADYKMATENTVFYYHQPVFSQSGVVNSSRDMDTLSAHYKYCQQKVDAVLKSICKITPKQWSKNFEQSTGYYFDAPQALRYKLIDKITESEKVDFEISDMTEGE